MTGFAHGLPTAATTLSEIMRIRQAVSADRLFGCFAYATQSGFRAFDLAVGDDFWSSTKTRWLFGIDRGRTDPRALREIAKRANTQVRIYDGRFVVAQDAFLPRRDFHPKVTFVKNAASGAQGLVLGSGNFSDNGLRRSVEAGWAAFASKKADIDRQIAPVNSAFEALWATACPMSEIIDAYERRLGELISSRDQARSINLEESRRAFWIEAGYVTPNRTWPRPGNQIFAPSGFRRFFGLSKTKANSTLIGAITFTMSVGPDVTKNYRENDNKMEKLTLPFPEQHGFGVYDGKVLVFQPTGNKFLLNALESDEFEAVYSHRLANVGVMNQGRRFGELV